MKPFEWTLVTALPQSHGCVERSAARFKESSWMPSDLLARHQPPAPARALPESGGQHAALQTLRVGQGLTGCRGSVWSARVFSAALATRFAERRPVLFLTALLLWVPFAAADSLQVLRPEQPRAFFFRQAEGAARAGRTEYAQWDAQFSRLQGIMGKCLDEEIPGTMSRNPEFFRRFKQAHPDQVVLLHFNGNACDPRFAGNRYFSGHWIHRTATEITQDVPAESGETTIHVQDAGDFMVNSGRYQNANDDIALFAIGPDGKHDWSRCEQVQLVAVDSAARTIRVRRGCYGTQPLHFEANQARAAAHMTEGPWGKQNHLLWFYNFTTHCPRDAHGSTATDVLVDRFAEWYGADGPLHGLDGVEFDVMHHITHGDTTGDGRMDDGMVAGEHRYGNGMVEFARALRKRMGPDFIIQGDGALGDGGIRSQRAFHILNGIESEGWPNLRDWEFNDWSGGLNRHGFWQANAYPPAFSYINHKWIESVPGQPGITADPDVPFSRHRLALAGAVFTDSAITFSLTPGRNDQGQPGIWDELIGGTENRVAWLGRAQGPAVHLATGQPDLLSGVAMKDRIRGDVIVAADAEGITIAPAASHQGNQFRFRIADVSTSGPDLLLSLTMQGETPSGWPPEMARFAEVGVSSGIIECLPPAPETFGMKLRGQPERPLDPATGASVRYLPRCTIGDTTFPALAVHPPYKSAKGSVHWSCDVDLDRDLDLHFAIGMGARSPERSDGVVFQVLVAELTNGQPARFERVFEAGTKEHRWLPQSVSLRRWIGRHVRLQFVADCGPADDTTTDHAFWGDVRLVPANQPEDTLTARESHMTWLGGDPFTSYFYFRDIRSETVNLNFTIEGVAPVTIKQLTAHASADLMFREFEHGLVLANPSRRPRTFQLGQFFPGQSFRRLQATSTQDLKTNDGSEVRESLVLGERDAIFLRK